MGIGISHILFALFYIDEGVDGGAGKRAQIELSK
jgi:hypothetical protein